VNKREFIRALDHFKSINSTEIENIQSLVNEFPYFQSAQLLLTKAFHSSDNFNFEQQLRKTAAYAADRRILHELLFANTAVIEPIETEVHVPEESEEVTTPIVEVNNKEEKINSTKKEHKEVNLSLAIIEKSDQINDELEQQVLTSAINSSILLEVSDEINLEDFPIRETSKTVQNQKEIEQGTSNNFNDLESHSFSGWLSHYSDNNNKKPLWESVEEVEKAKSMVDSKSNLPSKHEFYSPSKMAKLSVQDNDDLITETLANIYADQENFEKAIKSFQKLQLKYPEKKIYFAGRIKEIENQLNSQ
jgi:hypothetical protein